MPTKDDMEWMKDTINKSLDHCGIEMHYDLDDYTMATFQEKTTGNVVDSIATNTKGEMHDALVYARQGIKIGKACGK